MTAQSVYVLPCPCGAQVESHAPRAKCTSCGRELELAAFAGVELGTEPQALTRDPRFDDLDRLIAAEGEVIVDSPRWRRRRKVQGGRPRKTYSARRATAPWEQRRAAYLRASGKFEQLRAEGLE